MVSCPFTVSVLLGVGGEAYTSVLHTGSLLVADSYLALSWDPECWLHIPQTKGSYEIFLKTSILRLSSKKVFFESVPQAARENFSIYGIVWELRNKNSCYTFPSLSDSNLPLERDSKIAPPCQGTVTLPITYSERLWFSKWPLCFIITKQNTDSVEDYSASLSN